FGAWSQRSFLSCLSTRRCLGGRPRSKMMGMGLSLVNDRPLELLHLLAGGISADFTAPLSIITRRLPAIICGGTPMRGVAVAADWGRAVMFSPAAVLGGFQLC
ncbi:unnamed protein product, partial [Ascophyllum nodosum]